MSLFTSFFRRDRKSTPIQSSRLTLEPLEDRDVPSSGWESIDGTGNNLTHTDWGSVGVELLRRAAAQYADGLSAPAEADRPDARTISNALDAQPDGTPTNSREM